MAMAFVAWCRLGHADPQAKDCIDAHADGQVLRGQHKLLDARRKFVACVAEGCPLLVQKDCAELLKEVDGATPSVVIAGLDAQGRDTTRISVKVDGRALASELDSVAIPLDPGAHSFEFTASNGAVQRVSLVLREAEKQRPVIADFRQRPPPESRSPAERSSEPAPPLLSYVFGGVGLAALGSFAYFAISGHAIENEFDECKPNCQGREDRASSMRTRYAIADVSLGVAIVSFGLGGYLWLSNEPPASATPTALRLGVRVGSRVQRDISLTAAATF